MMVRAPTGRYKVGASALPDRGDGPVYWTVQMTRSRSLREWLTGKGRLTYIIP